MMRITFEVWWLILFGYRRSVLDVRLFLPKKKEMKENDKEMMKDKKSVGNSITVYIKCG